MGLADLGGVNEKVIDEGSAWRAAARCREAAALGEEDPVPALWVSRG